MEHSGLMEPLGTTVLRFLTSVLLFEREPLVFFEKVVGDVLNVEGAHATAFKGVAIGDGLQS